MRDMSQTIEQLGSMPEAMTSLPQWLVWRFETFDGDKKPRKVPYYLNGKKRRGKQGADEDRAALATFEKVSSALASGRWDGIGFAFLPGDGLIGIDIDAAVNADTGEVSPICSEIIARCNSYTELSPSGSGVHIIVRGETPTFKDNTVKVEVFCGAQFFTCTGQQWGGTPSDVRPLAADTLAWLRSVVKGAPAAGSAPTAGGSSSSSNASGKYCIAALASAEQRIRSCGEGGRNNALNREAYGLGQLVHTGAISEGLIRAALMSAAQACGLSAAEAEQTINSGLRGGMAAPRSLPEPRVQERRPAQARAGGGSAPTADDEGQDDPTSGSAEEEEDRSWRKKLLVSESGGIKDCRENVYTVLMNHPRVKGLVAFDEFAYQIKKMRQPPWPSPEGEWTVNDDYELGLWLATQLRMVVRSEGVLVAGVAMAANRAKFHPVRDYLNALRWDGTPRLSHWLAECLGAEDNNYHGLVGRWYLMGMVNRAINPGCQMDNMIVLEGRQGEGKSSALRILGGEWFADTPVKVGDPDALLSLAGVWMYEIAELDSFNRADITAVKQYVTSREDRVREPYARRHTTRPRTCVLAGTTNQNEYLKDSTGARRFWPVAVGEMDLLKLSRWRDQLFAEARHLLEAGERYHPTREESRRYLEEQQQDREIQDPWLEEIADWLDDPAQAARSRFTTSNLLTECLRVPPDRIDGAKNMATRVGVVMHKLGWKKQRGTTGARVWYYVRPSASAAAEAGGPALSTPASEWDPV